MQIGDYVKQEYSGILRLGKVKEVIEGTDGDTWSYVKVDWVDDEKYESSMAWKEEVRKESYYQDLWRVDNVQRIDINKTIQTLLKLSKM
jgi:hypothetical protein|tara:strand:- start:1 stop:267 length:267 start_codon:yes stop_codon:yes gene_type:complete